MKNCCDSERKVIYYKDELKDEFSSAKIEPRIIDENYTYQHSSIWNFQSLLFQNVLSMPIKILYAKLKFRIRYVGKDKLKKAKGSGYFVYANHTQPFADTFIPSLAIYPKRNFFIVNPENISMKGLGRIVELLGAIPVPGNKVAMKHFLDIIKEKIDKDYAITIYPEAHIWPYYTKVRPFKSVSFKYPAKLNKPVYCMTNTYQAYGKNRDKIKIVTYIDGPFFSDDIFSIKDNQENLRNEVYNCMVERSKNSNIEFIKYIQYTEKGELSYDKN